MLQPTAMPTIIASDPAVPFTAQQIRALEIISGGASISEAAYALEVHRNTIGNWRRNIPAFAQELDFAIAEQASYCHEQAISLAPRAIEILGTVMISQDSTPSLKSRIAISILKMASNPKNVHKPAQPPTAPSQPPADDAPSNEDEFSTVPPVPVATQPTRKSREPGRNAHCPCNSGLKYKRCCANGTTTNSAPPSAHASPQILQSSQAPI